MKNTNGNTIGNLQLKRKKKGCRKIIFTFLQKTDKTLTIARERKTYFGSRSEKNI